MMEQEWSDMMELEWTGKMEQEWSDMLELEWTGMMERGWNDRTELEMTGMLEPKTGRLELGTDMPEPEKADRLGLEKADTLVLETDTPGRNVEPGCGEK